MDSIVDGWMQGKYTSSIGVRLGRRRENMRP